jgi:hypothetical protein
MIVAGAIIPGAALAEWAEWILEPAIEYRHEDNVNLSAFDEDELSDSIIGAWVRGGRVRQIGNFTRLQLTATADYRYYDTYDGMNRLGLQGTAAVVHKFGLGPAKPYLRPYLTIGYREYDVDIRSGWFGELGVQLGKRFTPRFDGYLALEYQNREAENGPGIVPGIGNDVFDISGLSFSATGNYLLAERWNLSGELGYYDGDFASNCDGGNVDIVLDSEYVKAIIRDPAFGGCSYRLGGDAWSAELNLTYALSSHASINAGFAYLDGQSDVLEYSNTVWRASLIYRY